MGCEKLNACTPFHNFKSMFSFGQIKTLAFAEVGECFPNINIHKEMNFCFVTNQGSKFTKIDTCHVDQLVLLKLNKFTPSKKKASRMFLTFNPKLSNVRSLLMCFHARLSTTKHMKPSSLTWLVYPVWCYFRWPPHLPQSWDEWKVADDLGRNMVCAINPSGPIPHWTIFQCTLLVFIKSTTVWANMYVVEVQTQTMNILLCNIMGWWQFVMNW